ncbi:MAG: DNA-binding domain-containing protein [Pseudomonadota bacterium]
MDPVPAHLRLGAWIRDPESATPPDGIEPRRLKVYADLFYRNVEGLLASAFPVIRRTLGDTAWHGLVRGFLREHPARTPLFAEVAREMLRYLELRAGQDRGDPPWLPELAHYEWVELALQVSDAAEGDIAHDPGGDLLAQAPALSPLAWPLAYAWPVHRIGPDHLPDAPDALPTLLLVRRLPDGEVAFSQLSPLAFRLLQRIGDEPARSGLEHLQALAAEAAASDTAAFVAEGARMLEAWREDGTLLGVHARR